MAKSFTKQMHNVSEKLKLTGIYLALTLITLAVFWPVHNFQFVNFDDHVYVTENPYVLAGMTWAGTAWAFTTEHSSNWHPLTWLSHMMDCQFFKNDAGWCHTVNMIFHIANTLLLFAILTQMTGLIWLSACVAAVFAVHPLHVESVAWVSERKDVFSTLFWLLTIWAYLNYVKRPTAGRYLPVILFFALGLMSKPMLVTLPFVLLLLDYWPLERFGRKSLCHLIFEKIPMFALSAASCAVTFLVQQRSGAMESTEAIPLKFRIANAFLSYAKYIQKTVWPDRLAFFYPHPGPDIQPWQVIISLLFLTAVSVYVIFQFRTHKYLLVGWLWFIVTLIPVIGLVQVGAQGMADRYAYVSLIGLFIIAAWGSSDLLTKLKCSWYVILISALTILFALSVCARLQVQYWRDSTSLFEHAIKVTDKNYTAHSCLAYVLCEQGKINQAIAHNRLAIEFDPTYLYAQYNLGCIFMQQGKLTEALKQFENVLQINSDYVKAHRNIAKILVKQDRPKEAIAHYENILKVQPMDYDAQNGIGIALAHIGELDEAVEHFNRAVKINPDIADAQNNLGFTLVRQGKLDQAAGYFAKAIQLDPNNAKTHYQFAHILSEKGHLNEAVDHLRKAVQLDPNYVDPLNNLSWFLAIHKEARFFDPNEAVHLASRACELTNHQDPAILDTLSLAYSVAGQPVLAVETAEKALKLAQSRADTRMTAQIQQRLSSFKKDSPSITSRQK